MNTIALDATFPKITFSAVALEPQNHTICIFFGVVDIEAGFWLFHPRIALALLFYKCPPIKELHIWYKMVGSSFYSMTTYFRHYFNSTVLLFLS